MFLQSIRKYCTVVSSIRGNRSVGYVNRAKYLQKLKDENPECIKAREQGLFVYFNKNRILVRREKSSLPIPLWLPYETTHHAFSKMKTRLDLEQNSVLLDVSPEGDIRFALQVQPLSEEKVEVLESIFGAKFEELRFMMPYLRVDASNLTRGRSLLYWHRKSQFCSNCGLKTSKNAAGSHRICTACRTIHYPSLWPVVMGLVHDKRRCLLVRQSVHVQGVYTAVAGFVEAGETSEQAMRREIAEEVGLEVDSLDYIHGQHWPFPMSSLMIGFLASAKSDQTLSLDEKEIEDAQWFDLKSVKNAFELVQKDPAIILSPPKNTLLIPPPGSLSHHLIREWISRNSQ